MENEDIVVRGLKINLKTIFSQLDKFNKAIDNTTSNVSNLGKAMNNAFKSTKIIAFASTIKSITESMINATKKQTEYIENLNLLQVAYGEVNNSGEQLVNTLSDVLGIDQSGLTKSLGTYRQMSSALGIVNDSADMLSENLLKLQLDMSSLYNLDFERAGKILQVTMAGNTKSIRALGGDITEATLQQTAWALGIEKTVENMNRAEKTMLIYLTIERQLSNANGDMVKTINSVANQTKIFREQIEMLARQIGGLFIPILQNVLPLLNGFLMALNEIIGMLLSLLGIDASTLASDFGIAAGNVLDLEENLNGASQAAKEAKKSLRGFDKLNVIRTPDKNKSGSSSGVIGTGIDKDILSKLKEYDLHLDKIRNNALKIKNQILKTLGFTEELNEETGEWEWKYNGIGATLKGLWKWFKDLTPLAKALTITMTTLFGYKMYSSASKLLSLIGNTKFFLPTYTLISTLTKELPSILSGTTSLRKELDGFSGSLSPLQKISTLLVGATGVVVGLKLANEGIKDITKNGANMGNVLETSLGGLSTIISGGIAGAGISGFTGGIIGMTLAGISLIVTAMETIREANNKLGVQLNDLREKSRSLYDEWNSLIENHNELLNRNNVEVDYYQRLYKELQGIVDENGKIKQGYEGRAQTIVNILNKALGLNIEIVDGEIVKWKELGEEIDNVIKKKEQELYLRTVDEQLETAIKGITEAEYQREQALDNLKRAQTEHNDLIKKYSEKLKISEQDLIDYNRGLINMNDLIEKYGLSAYASSKDLKKFNDEMLTSNMNLVQAQEDYQNLEGQINSYTQVIENSSKAYKLAQEGNMEALKFYVQYEKDAYWGSEKNTYTHWDTVIGVYNTKLKELETQKDKMSKEDYEKTKKNYEDLKDLAQDHYDKLELVTRTSMGEIDKEMVEKWKSIATNSMSEFTAMYKTLPEYLQRDLKQIFINAGIDMTSFIQEGANKNPIDVSINFSDQDVQKTLKKLVAPLETALGIKIPIKPYLNGGFPNKGELFIAREAGAEMVGSINNKPAVANNDQIVESISQGVYRAMKASGGNTTPVIIEATGDDSGLLNFINFKQKQKDRQYGF